MNEEHFSDTKIFDMFIICHLGEGVGLVLRSDMLPTLGLFLVALMISPRLKPSSFLTASSSDSDGLSDSLSDELSELELAPGLEVVCEW